jgi:hypothetical protein
MESRQIQIMKISKGSKQAYALQDFTFEAAMNI